MREIDFKRRRRKALSLCALAFVIWALFAFKDTRKDEMLPIADPSTQSLISVHLEMESQNSLFDSRTEQ